MCAIHTSVSSSNSTIAEVGREEVGHVAVKATSFFSHADTRLDSTPSLMSESILAALSSLSLGDAPRVASHAATDSQAAWADALATLSADAAPTGYRLLKTLVFKPKTAKSDTPIPLLVVTDEKTQTSTAAIGAHMKLKDLRLAVPELLHATLGATKDDVSPFSVTSANADKVRVLFDQEIVDSGATYAVHARSNAETVFVPGSALLAYLRETHVPLDAVAFSTLAAPARAPAPAKPEPKGKAADAKIADAELIGITVHKDLDFPEWYQQVLRKGDMLDYYDVSGCYIIKPWSYFVWESIQRMSIVCAADGRLFRRRDQEDWCAKLLLSYVCVV